jgi:hypothetical protein
MKTVQRRISQLEDRHSLPKELTAIMYERPIGARLATGGVGHYKSHLNRSVEAQVPIKPNISTNEQLCARLEYRT